MNNFARIFPFLWPSRHRLYLSFVFAALVALLWGANLSIVFPIVKVLLQGESLHTYLEKEIAASEKEIAANQEAIQRFEERLKTADERDTVVLLQKRARHESKLTTASQQLAGLQWLMLYVIPWMPEDQFDTFAVILTFLLTMTLIKLACIFTEDVLVGSVVQLTIMGIRKKCLRRVLALDYQTVIGKGTSELMSRFTFDMETLASGMALLGGKVIREPLKAITCVSFAFWVNWRLTLLSMVFVPLAALVFHRMGKVLKRASHRSMESMSRIYKVLEETFDAAKIVIAFDGGRRHRRHHHVENKAYYQKSMKVMTIDALTNPCTEMLGMTAVLLAMLPGSYLVLRGTTSIWGIRLASSQMDIAELSVLYALLAGVLDPVRKLSSVFGKLKKASAAADRVFELMDSQSLVEETRQPRTFPKQLKQIEFQDIGFSYQRDGGLNRLPALEHINLQVEAGEVIAVVGENGSGKSTLVNLLPRFFDPDHGGVLINGMDVRDFRFRDLRRAIGVVTQETLLLDDTIYENILYGNPLATRAEVERAAEQAHVTQFLEQLPDGFETRVGEKGSRLSGGQRQRIALARAILRDPSIFILDEATSAIDAQSECLIHQTLQSFVRGRTTFIITHSISPSILGLVTRIVVMDRGRLVATGPHEVLRETCDVYRRLYPLHAHATPRTAEIPGNSSRSPGGPREAA